MGHASSHRSGARPHLAAVLRAILFLAAFGLLLILAFAGTATASETYTIKQLTHDSVTTPYTLDVYWDRVVWYDQAGGDSEIIVWSGGESTAITNNSFSDWAPRISGDRVVWTARPVAGTDKEIYTWTPAGGVVRITNNSWEDDEPQVSGDRVVWQAVPPGGTDKEIYTWTPTSGSLRITDNAYADTEPQISGGRVVWTCSRGADNTEIYTWTAATGTVQRLTNNTYPDETPQVSGDRVVWRSRESDGDIYTWTPGGGTVQITRNDYTDVLPQVAGDRVAWLAVPSGSDTEVYTWTPGGGQTRITNNSFMDSEVHISGDRIVWQAEIDGGDTEICLWHPSSGTVRITNNDYSDIGPRISGRWIVWSGYPDHIPEVFLACPSPSVSGLTPASGSTTGSEDVVVTGANFTGATQVKFGGAVATDLRVLGSTKLTCKAPPHTKGKADVTVTTPGGTSSIADAGNDYYYLARSEQTDGKILYAGTWETVPATGASGGSYRKTSDDTGYAVVQFTGRCFDWVATKGPDMWEASVSVDGGAATTVRLYSVSTRHKQRVFSVGPLSSGSHIVRITWRSTPGKYINLDAVGTDGSLTTIPAITRYEETNSHLDYDPAWTSASSSSASAGNFVWTNTSGARVTFTFTGVRVNILGRKASSYGKATVTIDGGAPATIDFYAAATRYTTVWYSPFLRPGTHTVVIERAGTKNSDSTGYTIGLDALDVRGTLP